MKSYYFKIFRDFRDMKKYKTFFVKTLVALFSVMFFVSCTEKEEDTKSAACDIVSFKVKETLWNISGTNVTRDYSSATLPTPLTPTIEVSPGATVSPPSGVEQNNFFKDGGVEYIVTAEDRVTIKKYTVKAIRTKYSDCEILSFRAGGVIWNIEGDSILYSFPADTKEGSFIPTIDLSPGAKVSPLESEAQNFFTATGVKYTVTSEDGSKTKVYSVKARKKSTDCNILRFVVDGEEWEVSDRESTITKVYQTGTTEGLRTPSIEVSPGATVNPPSGEAQDFFAAAGVKYTVKAEDTTSQKTYTVKARITSSDCAIVLFSAGGTEWKINDDVITWTFPEGTTKGHLKPTITLSPGATIDPSANDLQDFFTGEGVTYTVTAENGLITKDYRVKAHVIKKYDDMSNWVALSRNGNHPWGDGKGSQDLWGGGNPMLILDDDPGSGWHSNLGASFPHAIIIDMKESKNVSQVAASGDYFNTVELYLTDELPIVGYSSHTVNWEDDPGWREYDYNVWANSFNGSSFIPETPPASWGAPIASGSGSSNSFSFTLPETVQGQYLIIRFPDNSTDWSTYIAMSAIKVYYTD
ncbi:MAG: hypothetical protein LBS55_10640 [Prevotellaceae bacterium]|jgi:thiamine pyrophosphokinase|nr:hypothetical protein [Prevotellaceae bacterium]